jgi:hypothetical protein
LTFNIVSRNYSATNTNKRIEINVSPKQAWKLKVEEFCHKHKKCLICDLNVNNQDVEHFVNLQKEIKLSGLPNYMGCRIPVVKFEPRIYKMNVSTLRGQDIV